MTALLDPEASTSAGARLSADAISQLVASAADGDEHAWNRLVEEFAGLVWAIARAHRLGDADAADVAETTWLRLAEQLDRLHEPARVGAWIATTARRECLRAMLRGARPVPHSHELPPPGHDAHDHDEPLLISQRDAVLWAAFARLSDRDQALLRMLIASPAPSYEEIGAALARPIASIGPTRLRALERLRREAWHLGLANGALEAWS